MSVKWFHSIGYQLWIKQLINHQVKFYLNVFRHNIFQICKHYILEHVDQKCLVFLPLVHKEKEIDKEKKRNILGKMLFMFFFVNCIQKKQNKWIQLNLFQTTISITDESFAHILGIHNYPAKWNLKKLKRKKIVLFSILQDK